MSLANYTEMAAAVESWLNRVGHSDVADNVADFIAFGQRTIHYTTDLKAMEDLQTLTVNAQSVALPADFLRVKTLIGAEGSGTWEILGAPHRDVMDYGRAGRPNTYDIIGSNFWFGPPPDQEYTAQLIYYKALPILSETNTTNWFTDNYPELLLTAAVVEALYFLKDDARAQVWEKKYQQHKIAILQSEARSDREGGGMRVRLK